MQKYSNSAFIAKGRRKYRYLLQRIQDLDMYESIYYSRQNGSEGVEEPSLNIDTSRSPSNI